MLGMVLDQQMPMQPRSAASQPYVPPRIQWLLLPSATTPTPKFLASSTARAMARLAFRGPKPRCPSQRSIAPKEATHSASTDGSISPFFRYSITRGKRFSPWEYTPQRLFWAKISAASWARSGEKPYLFSTRSNSLSMVS